MIALIVLAAIALAMTLPCLFVPNTHRLAPVLDRMAKAGAYTSALLLPVSLFVIAHCGGAS